MDHIQIATTKNLRNSKKMQDENVDTLSLWHSNIARRKLLDMMMDSFCIGNTNARSLFGTNEKLPNHVRLLYVGVGDIRNPLTSLQRIGNDKIVHLTLNDCSSFTLARDVCLLLLGVQDIQAAIGCWSDLQLTPLEAQTLLTILDGLSLKQPPRWISMNSTTFEALCSHWKIWKDHLSQPERLRQRLLQVRNETLASKESGHGRVGVSEYWKNVGVSSVTPFMATFCDVVNPLLFDMTRSEILYQEHQGPGAAFAPLERYHIGGTAFAQTLYSCWGPLFETLIHHLGKSSISISICLGDAVTLAMQNQLGNDYTAIDTSNLMDYLGFWNLLLVLGPLLSDLPGSFIFTEQILGMSTSIDEMLEETLPHDSEMARTLLQLIGFVVDNVPQEIQPQKSEKVVHARWITTTPSLVTLDMALLVKKKEALVEEILRQVISLPARMVPALSTLWLSELNELVHICTNELDEKRRKHQVVSMVKSCASTMTNTSESASHFISYLNSFMHSIFVPSYLTPEMLQNVYRAVELSYAFPVYTVATFFAFLRNVIRCCKPAHQVFDGILDRFFGDVTLFNYEHVRNRFLAACLEVKSNPKSLKPALHDVSVNKMLEIVVQSPIRRFQCTIQPLQNLKERRGGILEPALAVYLVRNQRLVERLMDWNGMWKELSDESVNMGYEFITNAKLRDVQILDSLQFDLASCTLSVVLPEFLVCQDTVFESMSFEYLLLVDIQQYKVISKPVALKSMVSCLYL